MRAEATAEVVNQSNRVHKSQRKADRKLGCSRSSDRRWSREFCEQGEKKTTKKEAMQVHVKITVLRLKSDLSPLNFA